MSACLVGMNSITMYTPIASKCVAMPGANELEFSGRIESVTPDAIKVRGVTIYNRSEQTYIDDGQGEDQIPFENLVVGQVVRVSGTPIDAGACRTVCRSHLHFGFRFKQATKIVAFVSQVS